MVGSSIFLTMVVQQLIVILVLRHQSRRHISFYSVTLEVSFLLHLETFDLYVLMLKSSKYRSFIN